jgi:cytochrome c-type biogenesis protein CcmF
MIVELGHLAEIIALVLACLLTALPAVGVWQGNLRLMRTAPSIATGMFVFLVISFMCLGYAFATDDFSVVLVANNSNLSLPMVYKLCAVFGNHEGSLLMWVLFLALWSALVAHFSQALSDDMRARVLSVMGFVAVGLLLFSLLTSNPFLRSFPIVPVDGKDLNPLLQDFGMIVHPPMLYMGYVGFSVAFAFAIAALSSGKLDASWARWSRPWTNIAWAFLTVGIALGSWWAYYELGWGGWWFWDPVENASFMPWLVGTALMHSLSVTEKRGLFKSWTVLLAIFAFSLSLLGTFLVRSGVLTSVHSFAADPERGVFILGFIGVVIGASLSLYAFKAPAVSAKSRFEFLSREAFLLVNNVVLLVSTLTVLAGTIFPLITDALNLGKYSVGPPYFNAVFVPLMAFLIAFMGVGPLLNWKSTRTQQIKRHLLSVLLGSLISVGIIAISVLARVDTWSVLAILFAFWLICSVAVDLRAKLKNAPTLQRGLRRLTASYYGMLLGHIGFAVCVLGVCIVSQFNIENDLRMAPGESVQIEDYRFVFEGTRKLTGPNFTGEEGIVQVYQDDALIATLHPQKRRYSGRGMVMTEAAIDPGLWRDLYVAMGEPLNDGAWAMRLHYKPLVRFIWLGALIMALGGLMAIIDKRYKLKLSVRQVATDEVRRVA